MHVEDANSKVSSVSPSSSLSVTLPLSFDLVLYFHFFSSKINSGSLALDVIIEWVLNCPSPPIRDKITNVIKQSGRSFDQSAHFNGKLIEKYR